MSILIGLLVAAGVFMSWAATAPKADVDRFTSRTWTALGSAFLFGAAAALALAAIGLEVSG